MRFLTRSLAALIALGMATTVSPGAQGQQAAQPAAAMVARGKYLVTVQDCNGCHTPFNRGEPDMTKALSGHPQSLPAITAGPRLPAGWETSINSTNTAWSGPWGVSFTSNLTSDRATGIGAWSEQQFITAIREGKKSGSATGRTMLPPMPWRMYAQLTDDDLKAMFAYLMTVPAISNRVPAAVIAPPAPAR